MPELGPCWETGLRPINKDGYVGVKLPGTKGRSFSIHRLSFVIAGGVLDPELEIMHKCNNRGCYNPKHLEQGTHYENMQAMDYGSRPPRNLLSECKNGHPLTEGNIMYSKGGTVRRCRKCRTGKMKVYKATYRNKVV